MTATTATSKTILITGATRGIGLKLAELYIKLGWNVIGAARDPAKADQLKALSPFKIVQLDAADENSILSAANELAGEAIDLLINNAGILTAADFASTTKTDLLQQYEVNAVGPFLVTRAFVPHLKAAVAKNGAAAVAQISSQIGSITMNTGEWHGYHGYRASKAALNQLHASITIDLKSDGIAAFALHPGVVVTDLTGQGSITADESASALVDVIAKLTIDDTGKFYSYTGDSLPW
ncbi:Short chain dehydrogenase [Globisporangium polare]